MDEVYKEIRNHPSYEVSNLGNIRRKKSRLIVTPSVVSGYLRVSLDGEKLYVHKIVAETFIPNPKGKKFVTHKDGNTLLNSYENLVWTTARESQKIAVFRKLFGL